MDSRLSLPINSNIYIKQLYQPLISICATSNGTAMATFNLDEYYMGYASHIATASQDPMTKVGACIISQDNKVVGVGYNAMPAYKETKYPWTKNEENYKSKHTYVCHSELNAIMNSFTADLKGCKMYVTRHPCNECAKLITQSGITEIIYRDNDKPDRWDTLGAQRIFKISGIQIRQYP